MFPLTKKVCLPFVVYAFISCANAMQESVPAVVSQPLQQNSFSFVPDEIIKQIASYLDSASCGLMRQVCTRFNNNAWQHDYKFKIKSKKEFSQSQQDFWQNVFVRIRYFQSIIQKHNACNDIMLILRVRYPEWGLEPWEEIEKLSLPQELSTTKVSGLRMRADSFNDAEVTRLPLVLPNLKHLTLIGYSYGGNQLPSMLTQLTNIEALKVRNYTINRKDFSKIPPSVRVLALECCQMTKLSSTFISCLTSLRSLSLASSRLPTDEFEKISSCASYLERLNLRFNRLKTLPSCLVNFEKLQELDLRGCSHLTEESLIFLSKLKRFRLLHGPGIFDKKNY